MLENKTREQIIEMILELKEVNSSAVFRDYLETLDLEELQDTFNEEYQDFNDMSNDEKEVYNWLTKIF